jgi:hypothetical protein
MVRAGRRILLAPITISPTKPLTPAHLKFLLSLDVLYRATTLVADVRLVYHHQPFTCTRQVAGFWDYLGRAHPRLRFAELTEEEIGDLYVAYHRCAPVPYAVIEPIVRHAAAGWMHPASERLLDIWESHYRLLGLGDLALGRSGPPLMPPEEVLDLLRRAALCVDGRPLRAPVYLDGTRAGLPLRVMISADGQPNYLLHLLRQLIPLRDGYDLILLAHDRDLRPDYLLIQHVLTACGATVARFEVARVPLDGTALSTRYGGWHGYTLDRLAGPAINEFGPAAFRLGLRLYLVAGLGRTATQSFSARHFRRWLRRAATMLAGGRPEHAPALGGYLAGLAAARGYVDPYRLTTKMLTRGEGAPVRDLLHAVYL